MEDGIVTVLGGRLDTTHLVHFALVWHLWL